jgi:hypothetical protein
MGVKLDRSRCGRHIEEGCSRIGVLRKIFGPKRDKVMGLEKTALKGAL